MRELEDREQYGMRIKHAGKHMGFVAYFTSAGEPVFTDPSDPDASLATFQSRDHAYRIKAELETGGHLFAQVLIINDDTAEMVRLYSKRITYYFADRKVAIKAASDRAIREGEGETTPQPWLPYSIAREIAGVWTLRYKEGFINNL